MSVEITLREDSREAIVFTIKRDAIAYNLTGKAVKMRRRAGNGDEDVFATTDTDPLLIVTDAASGEVTFTPIENTWLGNDVDWLYNVYFDVEVTADNWLSWPEGTNIEIRITAEFGT